MSSSRPKYVPVVGPRLKRLLFVVFALFAVLSINAIYLSAVSLVEWYSKTTVQDYFYQIMFLLHLVLGFALLLPFLIYGVVHLKNAHNRPNRRAVKAGYVLFASSVLLMVSGLMLTQGIPLIAVQSETERNLVYWLHVVSPVAVIWIFVLHRLAGKRINWRAGFVTGAIAVLISSALILLQWQDPRRWNEVGPDDSQAYFYPSLARTVSGNFIPARTLMMDNYCKDCHADTHETWANSVHRFSSFNNPAYLFSVRNTREKSLERDGSVQASRFCAGCHDPVPFFSGAFDNPEFDDVNHPTAQAGITCTSCHGITHINSNRGNADYTIDEPLHYPFAYSQEPALKWVNHFLIKAKPEFHKKSFLKPLHRSTEFCGTCHKVHLPEELNGYRWLRGQNHYDSFWLSGVSGQGVSSFYYPKAAEGNCNGCHMPLMESADFGAKDYQGDGVNRVHDHQFPSANTAIPHLKDLPAWVNQKHEAFLENSLRVDIFGLREGGSLSDPLMAPLDASLPKLKPGQTYLLENVLRTLTLGHHFTQGTSDSNQIWLEVGVYSDGKLLGMSGGLDDAKRVDPWSHFVNAYVLDRNGKRINQRNAEDVFTTLYNNQIPPGAADTVFYRFTVPEQPATSLEFVVKLKYRKFDTEYLDLFRGPGVNDLPVITIAEDRIVLPIADVQLEPQNQKNPDEWERWYDYGIGLFLKPGTGALRQAEYAFRQVAELGHAKGFVGLARVFIREGRLQEAVEALKAASAAKYPSEPWVVSYFTGVVNLQNGFLDEAIYEFQRLRNTEFESARTRGFDFGKDYRLLNMLGQTLFERSKLARGDESAYTEFLQQAASIYQEALAFDSENSTTHYGLAQVYANLGQDDLAQKHRKLHAKYKVDDNARDRAIAIARAADPAADHAANDIVIYDLEFTRPSVVNLRK